ncbi:pseudaminic acid cytidylyltransferase [Psychrobacter sp. Arc29]|uniref:pseudaminic acid cytidylyltransferase n=1 Tax=Psychrobacter sp. Arc29 TaxID=3046690 RepID=UPI00352D8161
MRVAIIPARGGSKRIPQKNIKIFCGKPMIAWSIEAALESDCFDKVIVSTDDKAIADVAKSCGAEVPFIRPRELSDDFTGTIPVIKHAIEYLESQGETYEEVLCIYATAPLVTSKKIIKAYRQFKESKASYCFTATNYAAPIQRAFKINSNKRAEMFQPELFNERSQDLEEAYHDAGQFYWGRAEAFKQLIPVLSESASPYMLPRYLVQDIDTPDDWVLAELLYQVLQSKGSLDE